MEPCFDPASRQSGRRLVPGDARPSGLRAPRLRCWVAPQGCGWLALGVCLALLTACQPRKPEVSATPESSTSLEQMDQPTTQDLAAQPALMPSDASARAPESAGRSSTVGHEVTTGRDAPSASGGELSLESGAEGRTYIVRSGDTLYSIARAVYGDASGWRRIWEANRTRVADPNKLRVGTKLIIP